jgi:hypothetical protein
MDGYIQTYVLRGIGDDGAFKEDEVDEMLKIIKDYLDETVLPRGDTIEILSRIVKSEDFKRLPDV